MPEIPPALREVLDGCAAGTIPPNVALMRIYMAAPSAASANATVMTLADSAATRSSREAERIGAIARLHSSHADAWSSVHGVLDCVSHTGDMDASHIALGFDAAVRLSPEAAVALYALGDPAMLAAAAAEIVAKLKEWHLLDRGSVVLDLGCGIGRLATPLSEEGAHVVGIDISSEMLAAARRRCPEGMFVRMPGRDLACLADNVFDLVLAVDSFPYLLQAGRDVAACLIAEAARVLKPGGRLLILNFSYRGDVALDAREAAAIAKAAGFLPVRAGERPFALWDGAAYEFRRV
jgi:2-polyprenyl-3-methyl-5-hydroxy-6-metoxy-1,4-benzoquinol methylase